MGLKLKDYLLMMGMLLTGTINTISKKVQLDCEAIGITGLRNSSHATLHKFNKPWLQTLFMFVGEAFCLLGFAVIRYRKQRKQRKILSFGLIPPISSLTRNSYLSWIFVIPTILDLLGTSVAGISLVNIDASIWQMMRGSLIIFVGILSLIFLKRILHLFHWTGMSFTIIGLILVGLSGVLKHTDPSTQGGNKILGVSLVLVGSFISSSQMVLEEGILKKRGFHPLQVVGSEGVIGCFITGFIVLPILYFVHGSDYGSKENVKDGLYQIGQNPNLLINMILYIISIAFYNYFGLSISKNLTAIHRTLIDALRTILVWVVNLFIYYVIAPDFGESFDNSYGLLQIDGFAFLMIGTMIYNRVMNLNFIPFCYVEDDVSKKIVENVVDEDTNDNGSPNMDNKDEPLLKNT